MHRRSRQVCRKASGALSRIVTIENVEIKPIEEGDDSGDLRMSMTVNTYRYLEDAGDTTQPAGSQSQ